VQTRGLDLARRFYDGAIAPIVTCALGPGADVAAALIGPGSEVLGFDNERSRDHDWGPRCQLFLGGAALERREALETALTDGLPADFDGFPTGFSATDGRDNRGAAGGPGVLTHRVEVLDLVEWWRDWSGLAPGDERPAAGWLAVPTQRLAELTGGAVFADATGRLTAARTSLAWYPDDVWRYVLACSWRRIAEEQPFVGRCAEAGDDLGSALIAGRLARDVMRLWLLLERRYPPYSKWLGSAFAALPGTADVALDLRIAVTAGDIPARESALMRAFSATIERQNAAGLGSPTASGTSLFHTRPYRVVDADAAAAALLDAISDPELSGRPARAAIDAVTDNVAVTGDMATTRGIVEALMPRR
jgi:Domain of unknown function (DUF4037)